MPPNPNARRGFRVPLSTNGTFLAYPVQNNVVLRDLKDLRNGRSLVYTEYMGKVTAVQFSPNGEWLASGDDKGKVRIFNYQEESKEKWVVKKEHSILAASVNTIAWSEDGTKLTAAGDGKDMFAKAVIAESGTK